jgi:Holliday junction resolvasome RuvABC endonuclease subunit
MIILSIDPGLKNLGWAVYDTDAGSFKSFGRYNLLKDQPKEKHTKYTYLVKSFIDASKQVFASADLVCIEIQMSAKFKVIAAAFECFMWGKSIMVSPRSVRCHFKISMGNYAKNKKASVEIVPSLPISTLNKQWFERFDLNKRDDIADAILLALFSAYKQSETCAPRPKKRRRVYKDKSKE